MAGKPCPKPEPRAKKAPKRLKASRGNTVPPTTLRMLAKRARDICEARTPDCYSTFQVPHHRRMKAQGVDHRLLNLLAVCGDATTGCHGAIHRNAGWSYRHGFLLAAGDDPELLVVGCGFDCETDHREGDER